MTLAELALLGALIAVVITSAAFVLDLLVGFSADEHHRETDEPTIRE